MPPLVSSQPGRLWLVLWGSRLSRHVLLRFVLAARGPFSARVPPVQRPAQRPVQRAPLAPLVRSAPFIIRGQDKTRTTKTTREAGQRCRPGRSAGSACASG